MDLTLTEDSPRHHPDYVDGASHKTYGISVVDMRKNRDNLKQRILDRAWDIVNNSPEIMYSRAKEAWILMLEENNDPQNFRMKVFEYNSETNQIKILTKRQIDSL